MKLAIPTSTDLQKLLPQLRRAQPYLLGAFLIALFGYTAFMVNTALNVQPNEASASASQKVTFDKKTIDSLKQLDVVSGQLPATDLGKDNPFSR